MPLFKFKFKKIFFSFTKMFSYFKNHYLILKNVFYFRTLLLKIRTDFTENDFYSVLCFRIMYHNLYLNIYNFPNILYSLSILHVT